MKKWIPLFLLISLLLSSFGIAEDLEPNEGDGSGEVMIIEDGIGEDLQQSLKPYEPYSPKELEKAIIGTDNRVTVSNPSQWPYSAIALMDITAECNCHWTGSGFLVGDQGVFLTAAHCLVCSEHSKWANNIKFYFGYKSSKNYCYKYTGRWYAYAGNVFSSNKYTIQKDYAVVKLDRKIADKVGWFGAYWADSDADIQNYYAYVAGYRDGTLRFDSGYLMVLDDDHVKYLMDDVAGNSGGPIYTEDGYAIGIIIAEYMDINNNPINNIGYRLTYELWTKVEEIKIK